MSKKSNVINFKKEKLKKFDEENEIIFTVDDEKYTLGECVEQSQNDNGMEFVFKLDLEDDEETIH
tara:strand:- start:1212 stop:1406 length:195 start_codon:yes stop_codon:yes gene_type:complete